MRDPAVVDGWVETPGPVRRWVAVEGEEVVGLVSVPPARGGRRHVGELRLVVDPGAAARAWAARSPRTRCGASGRGLRKVVVDVVAEQEPAVADVLRVGFGGEAVLRDQIRDRAGALRDLLVLADDAEEEWSALASVGIEDELA